MIQSRRRFLVRATAGLVSALPSLDAFGSKADAPSARSRLRRIDRVKGVVPRDDTVVRFKCNGDIFPLTWLSNGAQFSSLSDGYGIARGSETTFYNTKALLIAGGPMDCSFEDIPSYPSLVTERVGHAARYYGVSALAIDGSIYHFLSCAQEDVGAGWGWNGVKVVCSSDHGKTWSNQNRTTPVVWESHEERSKKTMLFHDEPDCAFSLVSHVQMGMEYAANRDGFVYMYGTNGNTDGRMNQLVLTRVKKSRVLDRSAYEFYSDRTSRGRVEWVRDIERRGVVHTFPAGWVNIPRRGQNVVQAWLPSVVYNAPLGLYMMVASGVGCPNDGDWFGNSRPSYLGLWIANEPWGPWDQIYERGEWTPGGDAAARCYSPQISPKWMAQDGKSFWLVWSDFQSRCTKSDDEHARRAMGRADARAEKESIWRSHFVGCNPYYAFNTQRFDLGV